MASKGAYHSQCASFCRAWPAQQSVVVHWHARAGPLDQFYRDCLRFGNLKVSLVA